eukprot:899789-Rhodomonas_salina.7
MSGVSAAVLTESEEQEAVDAALRDLFLHNVQHLHDVVTYVLECVSERSVFECVFLYNVRDLHNLANTHAHIPF